MAIIESNKSDYQFSRLIVKKYDVRIDILHDMFRCIIDEEMVMENVDTDLGSGSIAIILWENDIVTSISAEVTDLMVFRLKQLD